MNVLTLLRVCVLVWSLSVSLQEQHVSSINSKCTNDSHEHKHKLIFIIYFLYWPVAVCVYQQCFTEVQTSVSRCLSSSRSSTRVSYTRWCMMLWRLQSRSYLAATDQLMTVAERLLFWPQRSSLHIATSCSSGISMNFFYLRPSSSWRILQLKCVSSVNVIQSATQMVLSSTFCYSTGDRYHCVTCIIFFCIYCSASN